MDTQKKAAGLSGKKPTFKWTALNQRRFYQYLTDNAGWAMPNNWYVAALDETRTKIAHVWELPRNKNGSAYITPKSWLQVDGFMEKLGFTHAALIYLVPSKYLPGCLLGEHKATMNTIARHGWKMARCAENFEVVDVVLGIAFGKVSYSQTANPRAEKGATIEVPTNLLKKNLPKGAIPMYYGQASC